jgi:hypothetical protein
MIKCRMMRPWGGEGWGGVGRNVLEADAGEEWVKRKFALVSIIFFF